MIILGTNSIKDTGYDVDNSLRFNSGSSDYLARTQGTPTSDKIGTISLWLKRSKLGNKRILVNRNDSNIWFFLDFRSDDKLRFATNNESDSDLNIELSCNRVFRDTAAWYHIVYKIDTTQATAGNRAKLYVNGVEETSFLTSTIPAQNTPCYSFVSSVSNGHAIGAYYNGSAYSEFQDGYFAEFCYIDGTALDATSFGEFDEDSGIWKPKNVSGLTFGDNGYYLEFKGTGTSADSSGMGADTSGNDNHFAVNNLTAIDQMVDTPTNNYATFNPLIVGEPAATFLGYTEGNLQGSSAGGVSANTILLPTSGKWFVEYHFNNASSSSDPGVGFWSIDTSQAHRWYQSSFKGLAWKYNAAVYLNGSNSFSATSFTSGDIISIAVDMDNNRVTFYKNGSAVNNLTNYSFDFTVSLGNFTVGIVDGRTASAGDANFDMNAGQNGTFNGRKTAGGNSDGDGYGNFSMAVPSGYFSLNTKNLAEYG